MKKVLFAVISVVMLAGIAAIAYAEREDWHGGIRDRVQATKQSIDRGIEQGSLTRQEARKLNEELDSILASIDRMRSDGRLDDREREKINSDLDRLDWDIRREIQNNDRRGDGDRAGWRGGIRDRVHEAKQNIDRGREHKTLTKREAKKLHNELDGILAKIDHMKSDGWLSEREREEINHDLDRLERHIIKEKRD